MVQVAKHLRTIKGFLRIL